MNKLVVVFFAASLVGPAGAQVNMQYSGQANGQYSGQYSGQVDLRVDGRANRHEGLPPSAADKANGVRQNPVYQDDCDEVNAFNPDVRPRWQDRIRAACNF